MTILREYDRAGNWTGRVKVTGTVSLPCGFWKIARSRGIHKCSLSGGYIVKGDSMFRFDDKFFSQSEKARVLSDVMLRHADEDERLMGRRACPVAPVAVTKHIQDSLADMCKRKESA